MNPKPCLLNRSNPLSIAIATALSITSPNPSYAEESARFQLEEVVVTARKVTESAQDIPVAINVFDQQTARDLNLSSVQNMVEFTPGATFSSSFPGEQRLSIRGVSSGDGSASGGAGVLMMVDDEVIARDFMYSSATFDISRVEVLRGPQGTTYGRNAAGGVVHVINNNPTQDNEIYTRINFGNFSQQEFEGLVNGALSDEVLGRLALLASRQDGYSEDALTGASVDDQSTIAARASILWDINENTELLLRGHWSQDNKDNPAPRKLRDASAPDGLGPIVITEPSQNPWEISNSDNLFYDRDIWGFSARLNWSGDYFDVTSITSFRDGEDQARVDLFGSPLDIVIQNSYNDARTYSQEVRLNGDLFQGNARWLAGLYYLHEEHERDELREILANNDTFEALGLSVIQHFNQDNQSDSYGLFGELSYDITTNTSLSLGIRYSYEEKDYQVLHEIIDLDLGNAHPLAIAVASNAVEDPSTPIVGATNDSWSSITGKLTLTHQLKDSSNLYFSLGNGTKSGGFNPEPYNLNALDESYNEESVVSAELGIKS